MEIPWLFRVGLNTLRRIAMASVPVARRRPRSGFFVLCVLVYLVGTFGTILLPFFDRKTYISDNALQPHWSYPSNNPVVFETVENYLGDVKDGKSFGHLYDSLVNSWDSSGAVVYGRYVNGSHPCVSKHFIVIGHVPGGRSTGDDQIILTTSPLIAQSTDFGEAVAELHSRGGMSSMLGSILLERLANVKWLHHDVFVASSVFELHQRSECQSPDVLKGLTESVVADRLHSSGDLTSLKVIGNTKTATKNSIASVLTARTRVALVLDISPYSFLGNARGNYVYMDTVSANGMLPNLDFVNLIHMIGEKMSRPGVPIEKVKSKLPPQLSGMTRDLLNTLKALQIVPHVRDVDYIRYEKFASHFLEQALGQSAGGHSHFRELNVPSLTLRSEYSVTRSGLHGRSFSSFVQFLESVIRCVNTIDEPLTRSYFMYFITGPTRFVGWEDFSPFMWMILAGPLLASISSVRAAFSCTYSKSEAVALFSLPVVSGSLWLIFVWLKMLPDVLAFAGLWTACIALYWKCSDFDWNTFQTVSVALRAATGVLLGLTLFSSSSLVPSTTLLMGIVLGAAVFLLGSNVVPASDSYCPSRIVLVVRSIVGMAVIFGLGMAGVSLPHLWSATASMYTVALLAASTLWVAMAHVVLLTTNVRAIFLPRPAKMKME